MNNGLVVLYNFDNPYNLIVGELLKLTESFVRSQSANNANYKIVIRVICSTNWSCI